MNEGNFALASRLTMALRRSLKTGAIAPPAFLKRCMIKSPTKIPPDSEKVGAKNRPRRAKIDAIPLCPWGSCLCDPKNASLVVSPVKYRFSFIKEEHRKDEEVVV